MISRNLVPPWRWFLEPSGGPTWPDGPVWLRWLDTQKRRPIVAHPMGAAIVVAAFLWVLTSPAVPAIAAALLAEATNQFHKSVRGVYGATLWLNVGWRMVLALVGAGIAWWVLP